MRLVSVWLRSLVVLSQVRVESAVAVGWTVVRAESTRAIRDVGVTSTAIVHVDHGLGVDVRQVVLWTRLEEREGA